MSATSEQAAHEYRVLERKDRFTGHIFSVVSELVAMPGGGSAWRDITHHIGSVAVVALDDEGRVTLIRQYRHPLRRQLWELPAGLADVAGESGLGTAQRELAEEADLTAARWDLLLDLHLSPGYSDELIRIFLARELSPVAEADRHTREDEEAEMTVHQFPLDEAVGMALRGEISNAATVSGLLATAWARDHDWTPLRPA